jgi:hypothetical protein
VYTHIFCDTFYCRVKRIGGVPSVLLVSQNFIMFGGATNKQTNGTQCVDAPFIKSGPYLFQSKSNSHVSLVLRVCINYTHMKDFC